MSHLSYDTKVAILCVLGVALIVARVLDIALTSWEEYKNDSQTHR